MFVTVRGKHKQRCAKFLYLVWVPCMVTIRKDDFWLQQAHRRAKSRAGKSRFYFIKGYQKSQIVYLSERITTKNGDGSHVYAFMDSAWGRKIPVEVKDLLLDKSYMGTYLFWDQKKATDQLSNQILKKISDHRERKPKVDFDVVLKGSGWCGIVGDLFSLVHLPGLCTKIMYGFPGVILQEYHI